MADLTQFLVLLLACAFMAVLLSRWLHHRRVNREYDEMRRDLRRRYGQWTTIE